MKCCLSSMLSKQSFHGSKEESGLILSELLVVLAIAASLLGTETKR